MIVTLQHLKDHLVIEHDEDDLYLLNILQVAEDAVKKNTNIKDFDGEGGEPSPSYIQAVLLLAANLYANREPVAYNNAQKIPYTFEYLISLNKNYSEEQ